MASAKLPRKGRASNVLVVDDESEPRQALALLLTSAGFNVRQSASAEEAARALAGGDVGIVVVDGDMPDVSGFVLCQRIREKHGSNIYLILRTTKEQLFSREFAIDEGADDFLIEPLSDQEVIARVETGRKMKELQERLQETTQSLELLEVTDPLTGVLTRRRIDTEIQRELDRSRRYGRPLSLVILDIDRFRRLNDELGRAAGDRVLAEVARVLRLCTRTTDAVGRFGGEEFAVVLPETGGEQAVGAAEKMRSVIERTAIAVGDRPVHVTVSGGVATFEDNNYDTAGAFVAAAETALLDAKAAGRNRCSAARPQGKGADNA